MLFWMARRAVDGASRDPRGCGIGLLFGLLFMVVLAGVRAVSPGWDSQDQVMLTLVITIGAAAGLGLWLEKREKRRK